MHSLWKFQEIQKDEHIHDARVCQDGTSKTLPRANDDGIARKDLDLWRGGDAPLQEQQCDMRHLVSH